MSEFRGGGPVLAYSFFRKVGAVYLCGSSRAVFFLRGLTPTIITFEGGAFMRSVFVRYYEGGNSVLAVS